MNNHNGPVTAEEFDRLFDEGKEDIIQYLDLSSARRLNQDARRVNVDMPVWMLNALDREADRLNISRQAVIKTMLDAQLRSGNAPRA